MTASVPTPAAGRVAVYSDVDGTLTRSNIVGPLLYIRQRLLTRPQRLLWMAGLPLRGLQWAIQDRFSRAASNRSIYASYRGLSSAAVRALAPGCFEAYLRPRLFAEARARLEALRREGFRLVLVTGSLRLFMEPLAELLGAELIAVELEERAGSFTGALSGPPLTGPRKAEAVREHAAREGLSLADSWAFGDAISDLEMLEVVGHPLAVRPDRGLEAAARARGWPIQHWE